MTIFSYRLGNGLTIRRIRIRTRTRTRTRVRAVAAVASAVVATALLAGCAGSTITDPSAPASPGPSAPAQAAAQAYADCMTRLGHAAVVQDGEVVYQVDTGSPVEVDASTLAADEATCAAEVPAYHAPDNDQR